MRVRQMARNAVRPGYASVMLGKVFKRLELSTRDQAASWARSCAISLDDYCSNLHSELWEETSEWAQLTDQQNRSMIEATGADLGGGGAYTLLYFLTRLHHPSVVVETGVAAGWSSRAFLAALDRNGNGHLYSSDFPYFRLSDPEQYIGIVVPEQLRTRWTLDVRGDRKALPALLRTAGQVDIFHYDSDKSRSGRDWALQQILRHLSKDSFIIMDDIQDNTFFRDLVMKMGCKYSVFEFEGKFLGMLDTSR